MNKLTNVSVKMWIFLTITLISAIIMVIFILNYKIEVTADVVIRPSFSKNAVFVSSEDAFKMKINDHIVLVVHKKYYDVSIKEIKQDDKNKFMLILNENLPLVGEDISRPAKVIYEDETIASMLFKHI